MAAVMPWDKPMGHASSGTPNEKAVKAARQLAAAQALEKILQTPITFVPATHRTKEDEQRMSSSVTRPLPNSSKPSSEKSTKKAIKEMESDEDNDDAQSLPSLPVIWHAKMPGSLRSRGLNNPHVMCYRNSTLQALLHLPMVHAWVSDHLAHCSAEIECALCALGGLSEEYWRNGKEVNRKMTVMTGTLRGSKSFKRWRWAEQQDSNEFYLKLIDAIADERPKGDKTVQSIFGHQTARTTVCSACSHRSRVVSPFEYRLGIALEGSNRLEEIMQRNTFASTSVSDYQCEKCKHRGRAKQASTLIALPEVLEIDFLRFKQVGFGRYVKNSKLVKFGLDLDLGSFCEREERHKYRLQAVIQHVGSFSTGHYRCIARGPGGAWVELDDTSVRKVKAETALQPGEGWTPYTLFLTRQSPFTETSAPSEEPDAMQDRETQSSPQAAVKSHGHSASKRKRKSSHNGSDRDKLIRHRMRSV